MLRRDSSTAAVLLALTICASHSLAQDRLWRPYAELETRGSSIRWAQQGVLFAPLWQDGDGLVFADLRGHWTDSQAAEANYALGYRQMLVNDWIFGVFGGLDLRHSELGNSFQQGTFGLEYLNPWWGLRWNGYFPGQGPKLAPALNVASLSGNNILIQQASERAYQGTDFEVERLLISGGPARMLPCFAFQELELWAAVGAFHFENDTAGFDNITGPRARCELRFYDVPWAGPDSRFVISGQYEYDDVRGSVGTGMLTFRIPFGRGGGWSNGRLQGLNRRMVAPLVRDVDIITNVGFDAPEAAAFTHTGQRISQVVTIDANTANQAGVVTGAGDDSLVIVDGSAGTLMPTSTITTQTGQVLLGGGSDLLVTGLRSGAPAVFHAAGSRPTIDSGSNPILSAGNRSSILTMDLTNSGNGVAGILLNNATDVLVQQVGINLSGDSAVGIVSSGISSFLVRNTAITTSGAFADGLQSSGDSSYVVFNSAIRTFGQAADGIQTTGNSALLLQDSIISTSGDGGSEGIVALGNTQLTMGNSRVNVSGLATTGMIARSAAATDNLNVFLNGVRVTSTGDSVVLEGAGASTLSATIRGSSLTAEPGFTALNVQSSGTSTVTLNARGNTLDPQLGIIRLNEISGDLNVTQSAPGSGMDGIDAVNGIPAINVAVPGNAIDFDESPPPPLPILP